MRKPSKQESPQTPNRPSQLIFKNVSATFALFGEKKRSGRGWDSADSCSQSTLRLTSQQHKRRRAHVATNNP